MRAFNISFSMLSRGRAVLLLAFLFFIPGLVSAQSSTRYYVNHAAAPGGNGLSWSTAFRGIQSAIDAASEEAADEIWVAAGTYYPSKTPPGHTFFRQRTFYLGKPVRLYGGFDGTETTLESRDWNTHKTILSANLGNPEDSTDNFYHVVLIAGSKSEPLGDNVVLDGFTITGGHAYGTGAGDVKGFSVQNYWGGGIINVYASPVLRNLFIYRNTGFVGGGIHNFNSSPKISNSVIEGNGARYGSAGGGMYNNDYSSPVISNVIFRDNFNSDGGGMYNMNFSSPVLTGCEFINNKATNTGTMGLGGAIYSNSSSIKLTDVTIRNNRAENRGGGIYNESHDPGIHAELVNVRILDNEAARWEGGGIYNYGSTFSITITGGEISGNRSFGNGGGGMYTEKGASVSLTGTVVSGNSTSNGPGGGICNRNAGTITLTNVTLTGNRTARTSLTAEGGGFFSQGCKKVVITGGKIENNYAQHSGGGLYHSGGDSESNIFTGITIRKNESASYGGGASFSNAKNVRLSHLTVSENTAPSSGGLSVGNTISLYGSHLLIEKNTTTDTPYNGSGGGISLSSDLGGAVIELTDMTVRQNHSASDGGGIYIYSSKPRLDRVTVSGNTSKMGGGGISIGTSGNAVLTNVLVSGNQSETQGGGVYIENASPFLTNFTIAGNTAASAGGVYTRNAGNTQIRNSIVHGNSSGLGFLNGAPKRFYSMIQDRTETADGNIASTDPLFGSPATVPAPFTVGNYRLQNTSPLKDKGNNQYYDAGQTPDLSGVKGDLDYFSRIYNETVDMGAYEFGSSPLPVTLISFSGRLENNTVRLFWQTTEESSSSHFEIQRSKDARFWTSVGEVAAAGESNGLRSYVYADPHQFSVPGIVYYRLRMVDSDGTGANSNMIALRIPEDKTSRPVVSVYPNPVSDYLHIDWHHTIDRPVVYQLLNAAGQVVMETKDNRMEVKSFPEGLYFLRLKSGASVSGYKVLIRR